MPPRSERVMSRQELAELLDLNEDYVTELERKGVLKKLGPNAYSVALSVQGYIRMLRQDVIHRPKGGNGERAADLQEEQTRLTKARADKIEQELLESAGELVRKEDIVKSLAAVFAAFRAKMLSWPTKLGPRLAAAKTSPQALVILKEAVNEALRELENYLKD